MGFFSELHDITKWADPIGHYSLDMAHQSSTDIVNETSRAIENMFGKDTFVGGLGEHWKNMSQKDKEDFGRWATNTGLSAAAVYGGMSAAGAGGGGAAGAGEIGAGELGAGVMSGVDSGTAAAIGSGGGAGAYGAGMGVTSGVDAGTAGAIGGGGGGSGAGVMTSTAGAGGYSSYIPAATQGINALLGAYQSKKAADALLAGGDAANATQRYMFDTLNAQRAPYLTSGYNALDKINGLLNNPSSVRDDPGYQFGMNEGQRAIDNSASARGGIGGAALRAGTRFAEDYAGTKTNDIFNRYASVAGFGQTANQQANASGMNYANNVSNNQMGMGNALAANYLNQGNIYGNALNAIGSYYSQGG